MTAKALKARPVYQAVVQQAEVLVERLTRRRCPDLKTPPFAAFPARDVDPHS